MITAIELKNRLTKIFPTFDNEWVEDEEINSLHGVLLVFTPYFGSESSKFTEKQIKMLSVLINETVKNEDDLENAVSACFLEHLHQIKAEITLRPYLSKLAKTKLNA